MKVRPTNGTIIVKKIEVRQKQKGIILTMAVDGMSVEAVSMGYNIDPACPEEQKLVLYKTGHAFGITHRTSNKNLYVVEKRDVVGFAQIDDDEEIIDIETTKPVFGESREWLNDPTSLI